MKTTAQKIANRFNRDGQNFCDKKGKSLEEVCRKAGLKYPVETNPDFMKFTFTDSSVIVIGGGAWDIGFPECGCWQGAGHTLECEHS